MPNDGVRSAYDRIADTYAAQRDQFTSLPYLEAFIAHLPAGGTVLDLGCGAGLPVDAWLIDQGFAVQGIDISERMIALARANVPEAAYAQRDMTGLAPGERRVDGIVAFYSIFHTPRTHHQALLETMASFLPSGGAMLVTMGAGDWEGSEDFHGAEMHWSHFGPETNRTMIERAGFTVLHDAIDASGGEQHQIVIAIRQ